jgi:phosphoribosylanthranilate isomerase
MTRPRVKICGITRVEDAELAVALGADALGFVLWPQSPRAIRARAAARISERVPPFVARVGVVVDASPAEVITLTQVGHFDVIQLHGDEELERYAATPARLVKSVRAEKTDDVMRALALPPHVTPIVDAASRAARGGTGQRADWALAAEMARSRPVILAGGLTPENVRDAIEQVKPWAVDVSSGVEEAPGIKSPRRLKEFFRAIDLVNVSES